MFLANSLKEKLRRNFIENDTADTIEQTKFPYQKKKKDPRVLLSFRQKGDGENQDYLIPQNFFSTQKLQSLDRKEWESTFTLEKLHSEWKTRVNLDFENNYKKFSDDFVLPDVKKAKEKIKDLVNPDRLELKNKNWNISYNIKDDIKPELSKALFEIENGFKDFKVIPLKTPEVNEGVDTRDHIELDGKIWDISNQVNKKELKDNEEKKLNDAKENTIKYWRNNDEMRQNESPYPISNERKKIEIIRYFKKYRTPYQKNIDYYKTMEKIKEDTFIEREQAEKKVKYKNPGSEKYPEKINALVLKEMYSLYKNKYNETVGKLSKDELLKKQKQRNRFKWFDTDLSNKIYAINELTGDKFFERSKDEKKLKNSNKKNNYNTITYDTSLDNKSFGLEYYNSTRNKSNEKNLRESYFQEQQKRKRNRFYLAPLVSKGNEIYIEEEKMKDKSNKEYKITKRKLSLMKSLTDKNFYGEKYESKYPLNKRKYETIKKIEKEESLKDDYKINDYDKKINVPDNLFELLKESKKDSNKSQTVSTYFDVISKKSNCGKFFLPAYDKVAEKEARRIISLNKKNRLTKTFEYMHPGTYREFIFTENEITNKDENIIQRPKKVKMNLWSCCLNTDKNSQGCQKKAIKNFRWIYNP